VLLIFVSVATFMLFIIKKKCPYFRGTVYNEIV